jgi:hypothetical protein
LSDVLLGSGDSTSAGDCRVWYSGSLVPFFHCSSFFVRHPFPNALSRRHYSFCIYLLSCLTFKLSPNHWHSAISPQNCSSTRHFFAVDKQTLLSSIQSVRPVALVMSTNRYRFTCVATNMQDLINASLLELRRKSESNRLYLLATAATLVA